MTTDFRNLITRMANELDEYRRLLLDDCTVTHRLSNEARAALADEPAVPDVVGPEWQPCVKLPITVHVREQRPGEQHVSTREGITPVRPDDLVMRGVAGEEYPIGRELFHRTYRMGSADEPAVPQGREPTSVTGEPSDEELLELWHGSDWYNEGATLREFCSIARAVLARWGNPAPQQPADGEVAELVADLQECADSCILSSKPYWAEPMRRAAELLQRQVLVPVPGSERPWEREEWCDPNGLCWLGSAALDGCTPTWLYGPPAWAERFPNVHRVLLPAHSLPIPHQQENNND